ncbi:sigma-54-dependent transcriptional regulator [Oceanospirillum sediminis]|uniref:Sigma-54-dependent Fis family transcriptional regulator n=1 Tax=Oceanospirillum sediminis TaxID=2760088 RepID=A0A839IRH5_9GAMM|nr:sigma-54 dependent transcriptional regulator [Oceanospirillum sediminis]MBB1487099.1 sigma-54-dependent Fis family transcriptional regulator [Oceanospirillum sediminis]
MTQSQPRSTSQQNTHHSRGTVLLVDDEALVRQSTEKWLQMSGFDVIVCDSARNALQHICPEFTGIVVTDVRMPDMDGLTLMDQLLQQIPELPVVLVTGHGDVDMALNAMRKGAYDFIEKPFNPERLVETLQRACDKRRLMLENLRLQQHLSDSTGIDKRLLGISAPAQHLKQELLTLANLNTNVIIYGETGVGKEVAAQCLHEYSSRSKEKFVPINCGAIPESLIESELFGHEAGAFTGASKRRVGKFEYASGGTLFLDEIESMPLNLQIRLLRALQEGLIERLGGNKPIPVDLRIIAASKSNLKNDDNFRQDLFYRLNVTQLHIPPLRDRQEDIPLLFEHYIHQTAADHGREARPLPEQEVRNLQRYPWPGNIRELKNVAMRYALDLRLSVASILFPDEQPMQASELKTDPSQPLAVQVAAFEAEVIRRSLARHNGNIKAVLEILDLPRRTLNQKMARYGIRREEFTGED